MNNAFIILEAYTIFPGMSIEPIDDHHHNNTPLIDLEDTHEEHKEVLPTTRFLCFAYILQLVVKEAYRKRTDW